MTEQTLRLYYAPFFGTPGQSHQLLAQAAARHAPWLRDLSLGFGAHGKPYFLAAPQLQFNLSHSGTLWLCAFSAAPVGLDVQQKRPARRAALSRRFFHPVEDAWLRQGDYAAFFDLWCAKESYCKYTGQGLWSVLNKVSLVTPDGSFPAAPDAQLQLLDAFAGYAACVCTQAPVTVQLVVLDA